MITSLLLALIIATVLVLIVLVHVWHFRDQKTLNHLKCDYNQLDIKICYLQADMHSLKSFKAGLEKDWNLGDKRFGRLLKK